MEKVNVTVRMEADQVAFLDQLAHSDDRNRSYLINQAIESYLAERRWRIEETRKAIAEADAGDFVPDDEMETILRKWTQ
jgi:predicted transcriptional regulator